MVSWFLLEKNDYFYKIIMLNDNFTPATFVIDELCKTFYKTKRDATKLLHLIHHEGQAICGIYTHEIAETKIQEIMCSAQQYGYPLLCVMKPICQSQGTDTRKPSSDSSNMI